MVGANGIDVPLAQRWNGTTWSVLSSQSRAGANSNWLQDVSCAAATNCWAAGGAITNPFDYLALEHYAA
jgi:hypothetical protein